VYCLSQSQTAIQHARTTNVPDFILGENLTKTPCTPHEHARRDVLFLNIHNYERDFNFFLIHSHCWRHSWKQLLLEMVDVVPWDDPVREAEQGMQPVNPRK
jgi:hypothetical protein